MKKILFMTFFLLVIAVSFILLPANSVFAKQPKPELTVIVNPESGFPPASSGPIVPLKNFTVNIYRPDGTLIASKETDINGEAVFNFHYGKYIIAAPTPNHRFYMPTAIGFVFKPKNKVAHLYLPWLYSRDSWPTSHPLWFESLDLDTATPEHETMLKCFAGQTISVKVSWWSLKTTNSPVWYVSLFGDWQLTTPLSNLAMGGSGPGQNRFYERIATFAAPLEPGIYTVRVVGVLDFWWPCSYYTRFHYSAHLGRDTRIGILAQEPGEYENIGVATLKVVGFE
ncbi:hypothetical protein ACFLR7_06320 [Acidobacteriota bacterium]